MFQFDTNFDEFGDYVNNILVTKHAFHQTQIELDKLRPYLTGLTHILLSRSLIRLHNTE